MKQAIAFVCASVTAWLSQGTLALTDCAVELDRVALLPLTHTAVILSVLAGGLALAAVHRGAPLVSLAPLALCVLPWLPAPVPAAALLWSGPLALLPWAAAAASVLASVSRRRDVVVRRPAIAAGLTAAIVFMLAAWSVAPTLPGGDEPHYLIITQSLIADRDLRIENNHQRGDYRAYFGGELRPDFLRRGVDGEIYSIHAPGLPALVAPAFAIGGYRGVKVLLVLIAALGSALAWQLAWLRTGRADAAWFGWAAVVFATTTVFHAFSVYPDAVGGVLVLTGVWALVRLDAKRPPGHQAPAYLLHGAALAPLPWLHSRFALLAGVLGVLILVRIWTAPTNRVRAALAFVTVPGISCIGWIAYFVAIYGVADPSAPYGGEIGATEYIADGLAGLFFDQRFGLLAYAPVLAIAFAGFAVMRNRLSLELLLVVVPYLIVVTTFRMWWAGWSAPARFAAPVLPLLVIPAAEAWASMSRRATRVTALGSLALTVLTTTIVVAVDHGTLAYNVRTELSRWFGWLSRNADLVHALPVWSDREVELFRDSAIWCGALVAAWLLLRGLDRKPWLRSGGALVSVTALTFAVAAMIAATVVWSASGRDGLAPVAAQMHLLRRAVAEEPALGVGLRPPRAIGLDALPRELRLRPDLLPAAEGPAADRALLFAIPAVPAGEYRLRPRARPGDGTLTAGISREEFPLATFPATSPDPVVLRLPVEVRALLVWGDREAQAIVRGLTIEAVSLVSPSDRPTDAFAIHAVQYGAMTAFFLDDRSFPEADAFWVGGGLGTAIVLQPDATQGSISLRLRNAPVENRVTIEAGAWRTELPLSPGEERQLAVPIDVRSGIALVRISSSSGFRPSEVDPASRDTRYLGVRVSVN